MKRFVFSIILSLFVFSLTAQSSKPKITLKLKANPHFFQTPADGNMIQPTGVAVNSQGHIFVFNKGNRQLMQFDTEGKYIRSFGHGIFKDPHGIRIDEDDNIWTTDLESHLVIKMSPEGRVLMVIGQNGTSGLFEEVRKMVLFFKPADVAFGHDGEIYIADGYGNARVVHLDKDGNLIKAWGELGTEDGNFDNPHNIICDKEANVYVADRNNGRVQVFDSEGKFLQSWTNVGKPWGLAITDNQDIYMTDGDNEQLVQLDTKGNILGIYKAGSGTQAGKLRAAHGIAIGKDGALYVTEVLNWRVQRWERN